MKIKTSEVVFIVVVLALIAGAMNIAFKDYEYWEACKQAGGKVVKVPGAICVKDNDLNEIKLEIQS